MEKLNELIDLAQRLDAAMDDSESNVYQLTINSVGRVSFLADPRFLLETFESVDIIVTDSIELPFKIETQVDGVIFESWIPQDELDLLKGHIADEQIDEFRNPKQKKVIKIRPSSSSWDEKSPLTLACE